MKHLLQYFTELSLHPKNAEELKGLILQLAVQGKLTAKWREENPEVEPAAVLLERIQEEKAQLIAAKKIRKEKPLPEITEDEVPFVLPSSWLWSNFGASTLLISGRDLTPAEYSKNELLYPYLTGASQIKNGEIVLSRWTNEPKVISIFGDLLISCKGTIGKTIINNIGEIHIARQIMAIRTFNWIDVQFAKLFIDSYVSHLQYLSKSMIPGISREDILHAKFPLPPLEEQKAIVSVVNQLFTEVEQLENLTKARIQLKEDFVTSALHQLHTGDTATEWAFLQKHFATFFTEESNIKKLRESILQLAVQGKLTRHWRAENPAVEPASVLLERIKEEKEQLVKAKKIKKEKPLPEITEEELPYELPEGWVWCRFQDVIIDIEAGKSPKCYPGRADEDEWGIIKMSAISWGVFNEFENKTLPTEVEPFKDKEIKAGDFILTRANTSELIAKSVIVHEGVRSKLLLNDKTLRFKFSSFFKPHYLNLYNNGSQARTHYREVSSGTSDSMQNISRENIKLLVVPFPPYQEQKAIVEKVNTLLALCDQLEEAIQRSKATQEDWMKSSLREVFETQPANV